jgi:hypothetical protein
VKELLVMVPSRGRPQSIDRLLNAMEDTCRADTHLIVGVDQDDPFLDEYLAMTDVEFEIRVGLRQVVGWLNTLAMPRLNEYEAIGTIGDDNLPQTAGWDMEILNALADTPFAFGNDLYPREPGILACHVFARSETIGLLGYFALPSLRHMADLAWQAWGEACGITFLPDVILEHLHFTIGKSEPDQVYLDASAAGGQDLIEFGRYCRDGLNADVARMGGRQYTAESLQAFLRKLNLANIDGELV